MKKILLAVFITLIFLIVVFLLFLDERPRTANVQINIGSSERFTQEEIESAMDHVIASFGLPSSELTYLWYDEDISNDEIERLNHWAWDSAEKDSTIILFSTVVVRRAGPGWLSPGTFDEIGWVLVRDRQSGEWELIASGWAGVHF